MMFVLKSDAASNIVTGQSVIKMREMRGEVGKKTPKKMMDNPSFL